MSGERQQLTEKCRTLIVHRDEGGYGLTLSGDRPTRVQTVKAGGASHRAGVREGDVIIKVNGQQVTESSHSEVVKQIQLGSYVALTVVHASRFTSLAPMGHRGSARDLKEALLADPPSTPTSGEERRGSFRPSGPSPAGTEAERRFMGDKVHTLQLMVEQQHRVVEELKSQLARNNSKKTKTRLEAAVSQLAELEAQASRLRGSSNSPDKSPGDPSSSQWPPSPPPRPEPSSTGPVGLPPPLPSRNSVSSVVDLAAPLPPPRVPSQSLPPPPPNKGATRHGSAESLTSPGPPPPARRNSQVSPASPPRPTVLHGRTRSSPVSLADTLAAAPTSPDGSGGGGRKSPRYETPPGTPPPPYVPGSVELVAPGYGGVELVTWGGLTGGEGNSRPIITMEDTDTEDEEGQQAGFTLPPEGEHGPFNSLQELLSHAAHLAIFLNYVILNKDPAPLLFYLITDAYKAGNAREMRKWAYEIHSSFLVPCAPLQLPNLDSSIAMHIDTMLAGEAAERPESLQKLFWKARSKARDVLKVQLDDFRAQRAAGLGGMFGPPDPELKAAEETVDKRLAVINERLVPLLDSTAEDLENASDKTSTLCAALATVMAKVFVTKCPKALAIIDKIPTFVSKEKKKEKFLAKFLNSDVVVQGHHFQLNHYDQVTYCNHSQGIIWGVGPQGYKCENCDFNVHKKFVHRVEEACVGREEKKKKIGRVWPGSKSGGSNLDLRGLQVRMGGSKNPSVSPSPLRKEQADSSDPQNWQQPAGSNSSGSLLGGDGDLVDGSPCDGGDASVINIGEPGTGLPRSASTSSGSRMAAGKGADLRRSESAKDGESKLRRNGRRKGSNPELPSGKNNPSRFSMGDSDLVSKSGSSSSSSISELRLWEATTVLHTRTDLLQRADSDLAEPDLADPPDWRSSISAEQLARLSPSEQKRQDVINELFHTERSHVRNLKVLEHVFRRPLLECGLVPREVVDRLFPNLQEVISVHQSYHAAMKTLAKGGFPIGRVGSLLADMFLGSFGDKLISVGAEFTKNQKFTIEELKRIRKGDSRLEARLSELEQNPNCRRLQLQSILPVEHQRLVKYPLLLTQIKKHCDEDEDRDEYDQVTEATSRTKEILDSIDKQVAEAQNKQKMEEIQRCLDTQGLEKLGTETTVCVEYRNVDLTKFRLLYDGVLTLHLGGSESKGKRNIELHVLLLEDCVMFLQKQDEKYLLKFHTGSGVVSGGGRDDAKKIHSPVIKFTTMLVRPVATNKRAFYLMNTTQVGAQLYELVASSTNERKTWLDHINAASTAFKTRDPRGIGRHRSQQMSSMSFGGRPHQNHNGGDIAQVPERHPNSGAGRSQSFNEQSLRQKESILNRPLPSPPPSSQETLERKMERLARKDEEVARALEEKQKILADIFEVPPEDYDSITDLVTTEEARRDAKDVLLAVMGQADTLARCVNDCLRVSEEKEVVSDGAAGGSSRTVRLATPPSDKLLSLTSGINSNLTALLSLLQEQEDERQGMRRDLQSSQERIREMVTQGAEQSFSSRPVSFVSLESEECSTPGEDPHSSPSAAPSSSTPVRDATPTNHVLEVEGEKLEGVRLEGQLVEEEEEDEEVSKGVNAEGDKERTGKDEDGSLVASSEC